MSIRAEAATGAVASAGCAWLALFPAQSWPGRVTSQAARQHTLVTPPESADCQVGMTLNVAAPTDAGNSTSHVIARWPVPAFGANDHPNFAGDPGNAAATSTDVGTSPGSTTQ